MARRPDRPLTREEALRVQQELVRRAKEINKVTFSDLCGDHEKQLAFVKDRSRLLAAVCGRQCGKTEGMVIKALDVCQRTPFVTVLYITLSRPAAKRIVWPKLHRLDRELGLNAKFNGTDLTMTLPNGSMILLGGANDEAEIERYRGMSVPLVIIDEAQAFRSFLESLVTEILYPATIAYSGQICLIGTPNPSCTGFFFDATTGQGAGKWSVHHWTALDNAFLKDPVAELAQAKELHHLTDEHPIFRREWLGEWVRNDEGLVYEIKPFNIVDELPDVDDWSYVLGMDVGYVDATAFVVWAYSHVLGKSYVVESYQRTQLIPTAIAVEVEKLSERYDLEGVVIDPGGGGKFIVEELKQRYGIAAEVAKKRAKHAAIELVNGDLRSGSVNILRRPNEDLLHDASLLQWDYGRVPTLKHRGGEYRASDKLRIDDRTPDHLLDAFLYGYRKCRSYLWEREEEPPTPGSPEAMKAEEDEMLEAALRRAQGLTEGEWWEKGF